MANHHHLLRLSRSAARAPHLSAFTLIELLVVAAIIAVLAGLIVAGVGVTGEKKRVSIARAQVEKLATLIDTYKAKKGVYPPDNPSNTADPTNTSLFYELVGASSDPSGTYTTPFGNVTKATLNSAAGVGGIVNSAAATAGDEDRANVLHLLTEIRPEQTNTIVVGGARIVVFVAPEGPNGRILNPIYYRAGDHATNNPGHFDLWAIVKKRNGSPQVVGNWKD